MKYIIKFLSFSALVISLSSCGQNAIPSPGETKSISQNAIEFSHQLEITPERQIIDVRTPEEFSAGYINGAININIYDADFDQRINQLDKNKAIFVYCKGGGRSAEATKKMTEFGFKLVYDLKGGMMAWTNNNLPITSAKNVMADLFSRKDYDQLLQENTLLLIDYYAPWCGPCKKMEPILEQLSKEFEGKVAIIRINVDEASALAKELQIENIPVVTTHKYGLKIKHLSGFQSEEQLRILIAEIID